jgi:hypothetical protein
MTEPSSLHDARPDVGGAVSASEVGGVALHISINLEARTVAEGQSGRCEVKRAARLLGGCWCGVSVLGGEVGSRGAGFGVRRFEAMGKIWTELFRREDVDELGLLVSLSGCPFDVQMSERVLLSFAVKSGEHTFQVRHDLRTIRVSPRLLCIRYCRFVSGTRYKLPRRHKDRQAGPWGWKA